MLHAHTYHIRRTFTLKMKKHAIMFKTHLSSPNEPPRPIKNSRHPGKSILRFDIYPAS